MVKPLPEADFISPDSIAECFDGVSDELYRRLWASLEVQPDPLDSFECDDIVHWKERNSIVHVWDFFTEEEQVEVNRLIKKEEDEDA